VRASPLPASPLSLGPRTPSPGPPARTRGQRGAAAEREPDQAELAAEAERDQADQAVDAEAAAQWEAHVTAQLRAQVRAELQARPLGALPHPCAVPCWRPWRCAARGVLLFASAGGVARARHPELGGQRPATRLLHGSGRQPSGSERHGQ